MAAVTEADVYEALKDVYDPEIPILSVVDLGLIYDVKVNDGEVHVDMTLTAMGCPMAGSIGFSCEERLEQIPGVNKAYVDIVWDPPWTPELISEEGKKALGWE